MLQGHCECGKVRYQVDGEIHDYSHCHCGQCRRLHGAAFATFAGVHRGEVSWQKDGDALHSYTSSPSYQRLFCGTCGSSMAVLLEAEPDNVYLAMGTMAGDPKLPEGYHIFVGSKAPWHTISDTLPQYDEEPDA